MIAGGRFGDDGVFQGSTLGWWATGALAFNLMIIVTDLDQKKFTIFVLLLLLTELDSTWASSKCKEPSAASGWIGSLIYFSAHTYFIIGFFLALFFMLGMTTPRFNYWRLEPSEFVHYIQPWDAIEHPPSGTPSAARSPTSSTHPDVRWRDDRDQARGPGRRTNRTRPLSGQAHEVGRTTPRRHAGSTILIRPSRNRTRL